MFLVRYLATENDGLSELRRRMNRPRRIIFKCRVRD